MSGAVISLSDGHTATADVQGRYRLDLVPVGSYTVDVTDPATGDRGRASATISSQDQIVPTNVTLIGVGKVVVTVKDGSLNLVPGAQVQLNSQTIFGGRQTGSTQADGTLTFANVLAGNFSVSATNPQTNLTGSASGNVAVNSTTNTTVQLQSSGAVQGTVFGSNGTTTIPNISVQLSGPVTRQMSSGGLGNFRFDIVPTGSYQLRAIDSSGNIRASVGVSISTQDQLITQNLVLSGVATVTGRVLNPSSTPVAGAGVTLVIQGQSRNFSALTDVNGVYRFAQVPLGNFTLSTRVQSGSQVLLGENQGALVTDGSTVTADIQLLANVIQLPSTLFDANNFNYDLTQSATIAGGKGQIFGGDFASHQGGFLLDLISGGAVSSFTGQGTTQGLASTELSGRQIAVTQQGMAGLDVTRKVYVPQDGILCPLSGSAEEFRRISCHGRRKTYQQLPVHQQGAEWIYVQSRTAHCSHFQRRYGSC